MIMPERITTAPLSDHANRRRWIALIIVCLGQLMIVLDVTIVNVALPSIQSSLDFSQGNLTWVVDAYLITFGSFLLLAGRLGDLIGRKRVFLSGLALFILASAWCGLSDSEGMLIAGRFVQGLGGAFASSVILAIIVTEFPAGPLQARAMGVFAFVAVSGGSIGLLAGGWLTQTLSWHWIFFINIPIGVFTLIAGRARIVESEPLGLGAGLDVLGSFMVTASTMLGVFGVIKATNDGWGSAVTLGSMAGAAVLFGLFLLYEGRISNPIMPLHILRNRGLIGSSVVRGLLVTGMFSVFFLGALYLGKVLGYGATSTGLAFLPQTLLVAGMSLGLTARLMARFGAIRMIVFGLSSVFVSLILLAQIGEHTAYFPTIFIALILMGIGMGSSFMPLLVVAMAGVPREESGLGSGIVNVSVQLSAALGLAVLTTLSTNHTKSLLAAGDSAAGALVGGYQLAFYIGAGCVALGMIVALAVLRNPPARPPEILDEEPLQDAPLAPRELEPAAA
jgi:EmrB/QacA subfamily drug resistance transporter